MLSLASIAGVSGHAPHDALHVLSPITHGNLTIFPVVGGTDYDTSHLLTLDEGVKAGTVIITEQGALRGLVRGGQPISRGSTAEVNRLVLVNNSDRPLLLLAGRDRHRRQAGPRDRCRSPGAAHSDPIDLSVFCVEPGRWVSRSDQFGSMKSQMAQPSVRMPAMAAKDQQQVWNQVAEARRSAADVAAVTSASPMVQADNADLSTSFSQAQLRPDHVLRRDHGCAAGAGADRQRRRQLLEHRAASCARQARRAWWSLSTVRLVWADVFASNDLLMRYWEKLVRSYAAESLTTASAKGHVDQKEAQEFLEQMSGNREIIETEAGVFRRSEITGNSYKVFTLTALLPKTDFNVHTAKMGYDKEAKLQYPQYRVR